MRMGVEEEITNALCAILVEIRTHSSLLIHELSLTFSRPDDSSSLIRYSNFCCSWIEPFNSILMCVCMGDMGI